MGSDKDESFKPVRAKRKRRYRATYTITKTIHVDAYDEKEARREVDHFLAAIRGEVEVESIEEVEV